MDPQTEWVGMDWLRNLDRWHLFCFMGLRPAFSGERMVDCEAEGAQDLHALIPRIRMILFLTGSHPRVFVIHPGVTLNKMFREHKFSYFLRLPDSIFQPAKPYFDRTLNSGGFYSAFTKSHWRRKGNERKIRNSKRCHFSDRSRTPLRLGKATDEQKFLRFDLSSRGKLPFRP